MSRMHRIVAQLKGVSAPRRHSGFTLIELMIVVAVMGVLIAFAVSSYSSSVRKTRRNLAMGCLTERAQFMERFYTVNMRYDQDLAGNDVVIPDMNCATELAGFYTLSFGAGPDATSYTLRASPEGDQNDDVCGTLDLTSTGIKTADGTDCW